MDRVSFYDQIRRNKRNSWILMLAVFTGLILASIILSLVVGSIYDYGVMFIFLMLATIFNIGYILYTYYKSADIALKSVKAYPAEGQRYQQLLNIVEEMSIASGMPKPRVYIMPSPELNAFAAGRDPKNSVICVTEGALSAFTRQELQGVVAHEMTHIRNFDIRFVTLAATMVGLVSIISQIFLRSLWMGGRSRRRGGGNPLLLVAGILVAILAPLALKLVQLSISRKREFMADAGSVELTRYPKGLADALLKIQSSYSSRPQTQVVDAVAPMFIADPVKNRFVSLFRTHPPVEERLKALNAM
jgi:heat shock protein HtpX